MCGEQGDKEESEATSQYDGDTVNTDGATGIGTMMEDTGGDDLSDDISDTGWDTDLEIEGAWNSQNGLD